MLGNATDLVNFAADRGVTIDPDLANIFLNQATDYLNLQSWKGAPTDSEQDDCWPRSGIIGVSDSIVPKDVIKALYMLSSEVSNGVKLFASASGGRGIKQAAITGAVSVTYDDSDTTFGEQPYFPYLDGLIGKYLDGASVSPYNIPVWRV